MEHILLSWLLIVTVAVADLLVLLVVVLRLLLWLLLWLLLLLLLLVVVCLARGSRRLAITLAVTWVLAVVSIVVSLAVVALVVALIVALRLYKDNRNHVWSYYNKTLDYANLCSDHLDMGGGGGERQGIKQGSIKKRQCLLISLFRTASLVGLSRSH